MLGNHKLGLYEKALDPKDDWRVRFEKIKTMGFDFIEICIDEQDERIERLYWNDVKIESLRRMSFEAGIPIMSMCLSAHRRYAFGSEDPNKQRKAYEVMELAIKFCAQAGIRLIQLAGYDVYYEPTTAKSRENFLNGLRWAVKKAAQYEVMLGMEIMDTDFMNSIFRFKWYEQEINSPWFRVYPDIGNLTAWGNDIQNELREGIGSIVSIHVKETLPVTKDFPGKFKGVPFGQGTVDFEECFRVLEELQYTGPYMIEMWYDNGTNDVDVVSEAKSFIEEKYRCAIGDIL